MVSRIWSVEWCRFQRPIQWPRFHGHGVTIYRPWCLRRTV